MQIPNLSKFPWKEVMLGEGLLNIVIGISVLVAIRTLAEPTYNLLQGLSLNQMTSLLTLVAKGILAFGFLNMAIPLLFISISKFVQKEQPELVVEKAEQE
ncbi:hypothetical protein ACKFKG_22885 [Phormidesmis sp. 146-35]